MAKINEETFLLFIFITNYISPISFSMIISFFLIPIIYKVKLRYKRVQFFFFGGYTIKSQIHAASFYFSGIYNSRRFIRAQ